MPQRSTKTFSIIGIYGLGLLGGSLGMAVRQKRLADKVIGFVRNPKSITRGRQRKAVHEGVIGLTAEGIRACDLLILCVPIRSIIEALPKIKSAHPQRLVVMDVGSTKDEIVRSADRVFRNTGISFVGCHPMAGSERSGLDVASQDLFDQALCLITPGESSLRKDIRNVSRLWTKVGARTKKITAQEHDRVMAAVSHFPHVASAALMGVTNPKMWRFVGPGFRDMTRIAASDAKLWRDILFSNKAAVKKVYQDFERQLSALVHLIDQGDERSFVKRFQSISQSRKKLISVPRNSKF